MDWVHGGWARWAVVLGAAATLGVVGCGKSGNGSPGDGAAGADGSDGAGGPVDSRTLVEVIRERTEVKLDLLFVVDNSSSMADKQQLLAEAMPLLMQRLVTPICVRPCTAADNCDASQQRRGLPTGPAVDAEGNCVDGAPELPPIRDIHVGVISSSLGSHGATGADDACTSPAEDDHAHLLGEVRGEPATWNNAGFLAWDSRAKHAPPGDSDLAAFTQKATSSILSAGEAGCNYEATLEAWYRFLIDPEPPLSVYVPAGSGTAVREGVDEGVLAQRAAFLRPDSLVAIVMLSDENDCSVVDEGYGWLVARSAAMYRSTSACQANPNDACCQSCGETTPNPGCPALETDTRCQLGDFAALEGEDPPRLRCWQQKGRFGFDLLYPVLRYADALHSPVVTDRAGQFVQNPLFAAGEGLAPRDKSQVILAGIVGVPWQDLADASSLDGPGLRYLSAAELVAEDRWDFVLGDPSASPPLLPMDPFMVEATSERLGQHPVSGDRIVPASSNDPTASPINGHEQVNVDNGDLQYACTFPLATPRVCDEAALADGLGCDCYEEDRPRNRALCQPPEGGEATTTQYYAGAYPGLRQLHVLKELGDNAVAASICPKVVDPGSPDYGYAPFVDALVSQVRDRVGPRCLPRPLAPDDDGTLACTMVEARPSEPSDCDCEALGRASLEGKTEVAAAVRGKLANYQLCSTASSPACSAICLCELPQPSGNELQSCQGDPNPEGQAGWCYINANPNEPNVGNPDLVSACPAESKRVFRFVGDAPAEGAELVIVCEPSAVAPTLGEL